MCDAPIDLSDHLVRIRLNLEALGDRRDSAGCDRFHSFCLRHGVNESTDNQRLAMLSDKSVTSLDRQLMKMLEQN
jgi:hypothetical protein